MKTIKFCSIALLSLSLLLTAFANEETDVLDLLGKPVSSQEAREIIQKSGEKDIYVATGCYYYTFESAGFDLMMNNHDTIINIFLFAEGADDHKEYKGKLPSGLTFSHDRKQVEALLGAPDETGGNSVIKYYSNWNHKGISITYHNRDTTDMSAPIYNISIFEKEK